MTDILQRAWNVLEPGERPEGMEWHDVLDGWSDRGCWMPDHTAYDRLVVAVEGVLHHMGTDGGNHCAAEWFSDDGWQWTVHRETGSTDYLDPCRLTAAVLAVESERGSDA